MKQAFIFDLDDTLADTSHRHELMVRGEWDEYYSQCPHDKPIVALCTLATILYRAGYHIAIVTGRSANVVSETTRWLNTYTHFSSLRMRKKGDFRHNSAVKLEMLKEICREYDVLMVFDDQPAACKMWRDSGVRCAQVADGEAFIEHIRT